MPVAPLGGPDGAADEPEALEPKPAVVGTATSNGFPNTFSLSLDVAADAAPDARPLEVPEVEEGPGAGATSGPRWMKLLLPAPAGAAAPIDGFCPPDADGVGFLLPLLEDGPMGKAPPLPPEGADADAVGVTPAKNPPAGPPAPASPKP
jgi:hypothetical protein